MQELKKLIHEIHKRSLWQVISVYLAVSWGSLQVVQTVVESANLPEWLPGLALVLLLIGVPSVLQVFCSSGPCGRPASSRISTTLLRKAVRLTIAGA